MLAIYIHTKNDTNGNPRRGWMIVKPHSGHVVEFIEEGYEGRAALRKSYPNAVETGFIAVTPGEYRQQKNRK